MARHFARLKLTLLVAALRLSWQQLLGFLLSLLVGLPLALGAFALLVWLGGEAAGGSGLRLAFAVLTVLWMVGPPLLFGLDETLDPARLRLLPLTRRQLAGGLLAASAIGVGPLITLVALVGAVVGFAPAGPGAVIVVAAVLAHFLLCLTAARVVTTALSRWLRSRRGQDVIVIAGALLGVGMAGLGQVPNLLFNVIDDYGAFEAGLARVEAIVGVTPLAWAGSAVVAGSEGRLLVGAAWLLAAGGLVAALVAVWIRLLAGAATATPNHSGGGADRPLFSGLASVLPRNRLGASAAKELRYQWRVPQLRAQWIFMPLIAVALILGGLLVPGDVSRLLVFGVCGLVAFHGFSAINAFGGDRGAVWALVAAGGVGRADLAGKNAAGALVLLPLAAVVAMALAALSGGWAYVVPAVLGAVAVLACAYGVGNVVSVVAPTPLPESAANAWAGASGAGCAAAFAQALAVLVGGILLVPAALGVGLSVAFAPGWMIPASLVAACYGLGLWWLGLVISAQLAVKRGPEMVAALTRSA